MSFLEFANHASASTTSFRTQSEVYNLVRDACLANRDIASFHELGESEEGRPIFGVVVGSGPRTVSLIAGAHSDEPLGPETLRTFILEGLEQRELLDNLFSAYRFVIVPHINPDGEARNQRWIVQWPSLPAYLAHVFRELPGRDLEFGFPSMRQENRIVAAFLRNHAPFDLHMSLHGMGYSEGAMLLIERTWIDRTQMLRERFAAAAREEGLELHDHDRNGEKGFVYIEPGFTTTPMGEAMRVYFRERGEVEMASRFHDSSMEYVRSLGGDSLCLVTELPLFLLARQRQHRPGIPDTYLRFKDEVPRIKMELNRDPMRLVESYLGDFDIAPLSLPVAVKLQLKTISMGLEALPKALPTD